MPKNLIQQAIEKGHIEIDVVISESDAKALSVLEHVLEVLGEDTKTGEVLDILQDCTWWVITLATNHEFRVNQPKEE